MCCLGWLAAKGDADEDYGARGGVKYSCANAIPGSLPWVLDYKILANVVFSAEMFSLICFVNPLKVATENLKI